MICLWAFLLLAVATSSVNSQACSRPCTNSKDVKDALEDHAKEITDTKPDSKLNLEGLFSSVVNTVKSLTKLIFQDVNVETGELRNVTNGWELRAGLIIGANSQELNSFKIITNISANLNLTVKDGYSYWRLLEDTLNNSASVNGEKVLGLSSSMVKSVVDTVLKVLDRVLKRILNQVVEKLNYVNQEVTQPFLIGSTKCSHKLTGVTQKGGNVVGQFATTIGNQEVAWDKVGEIVLNANETHMWNIGHNPHNAVLESALLQVKSKINISKEQVSSQFWASEYGALSAEIKVTDLKSCKISKNGADLGLTLGVSLFDKLKRLSTLQGNAQVKAQPEYDNGYLTIVLNISAIFDIDFSTSDKVGPRLSDFTRSNINLFQKDLNSQTKQAMRLPAVTGQPGPKGRCESKLDYFRCAALK